MTQVRFASSIVRHTGPASVELSGSTVGELLAQAFLEHPRLRGYLLDDQGAVRKHITVFINDRTIADRDSLSDPVDADDCIYVFQALSGG